MTALSRAQATAAAVLIRDETATGANTATRVGTFCANIIDSTVFKGEAQTPPTAGNGLTGTSVFSVLPDSTTLTVSASGVKVSDLVGNSVFGRAAGSTGAPAAIAASVDGHALRLSGATLGFGTLATAAYADGSVTMAKHADLAGLSVHGRSVGTTGVPAAITAVTAGDTLRLSGGVLGFGAPDFGAQIITSTASLKIGPGTVNATSTVLMRGAHGKTFIGAKNNAGTDTTLLSFGAATNDQLILGDSAGATSLWNQVTTAGNVNWRFGTIIHVSSSQNGTVIGGAAAGYSLSFGDTVTTPTITQQTNVTNGATGKKLVAQAQSCTGTTSTGGAFDLGPGAGTSVGGLGRLINGGTGGGTVQRLGYNDTGVGLYTATPVAQASRVGQLTDSTTGTPSTTIPDAGVAYVQATMNNIHASLLTKINALETLIHNLGASA